MKTNNNRRDRSNSSACGSKTDRLNKNDHNPATPRSRSTTKSEALNYSRSFLSTTLQPHPFECLCKDCTCGRHLCKLQSPSLPFSLASTYKLHYPPRNPYKHREPIRPISAKLPSQPLLSASSTYLDNFTQNNGDALERPKPEDLMKCKGGPGAQLTSYKQQFPGHRGKNQYVPMNPQSFRGGLNFSSTSTYSQQYKIHGGKSSQNARPPDQLRMTGSWLGTSSYSNQFQNPSNQRSRGQEQRMTQSQCSARSQSSSWVEQRNPSSHFKTTYGSDFLAKSNPLCPASQKAMEAKTDLSKSNLKQNSYFKGMDSSFSPLAKFAF